MKDETTYTEQSDTLDTLGIAYQRLRSCSVCVDHSTVETLLLDNIEDVLNIWITELDLNKSIEDTLNIRITPKGFNELLDPLGKLYQRVASVNKGRTSEGNGKHQKVLALIQEILEKQL